MIVPFKNGMRSAYRYSITRATQLLNVPSIYDMDPGFLGIFLVNNTDYSMAGLLDQDLPRQPGGGPHEVNRDPAMAMVQENDAAFTEAYVRGHARANGKPIDATPEVIRGLVHASRNFKQAPPEHQELMKTVKAALNARGTYEFMVDHGRPVDPKATADLLHALHAEVQSGNITHPQTLKAAGLVLDAAPKLIPQLAPKLQANLSAGPTQNSLSEAFSQQAIAHAADAIHEKSRSDFTTVHGDVPHWKPLNEESQAWMREHPMAVPAHAQRVNTSTGKPELNIISLTNRQLPPQYANENVASAKGAIEAISKNPTASMEELAATVHDQWMQRNVHWAPASQMVPYARLSESDKQEDRDVVRVGQKAIAHAEKVSSANLVASSLPTQEAPSVPRINEPATGVSGAGAQRLSANVTSLPPHVTPEAPNGAVSSTLHATASTPGVSAPLPQLPSEKLSLSPTSPPPVVPAAPLSSPTRTAAPHVPPTSEPALATNDASAAGKVLKGANGKLGVMNIAVSAADAVINHDPSKAAALAGGMVATKVVAKGVAVAAGERFVPVVGEVIGGGFAAKDAYDSAKAGHYGRAGASGLEASLYAVSAGATVATVADCWNPTVVAPATVALVAGGAAVTMTAARGVVDNWHTVKGWFHHSAPPIVPSRHSSDRDKA